MDLAHIAVGGSRGYENQQVRQPLRQPARQPARQPNKNRPNYDTTGQNSERQPSALFDNEGFDLRQLNSQGNPQSDRQVYEQPQDNRQVYEERQSSRQLLRSNPKYRGEY